jgi:transcriptional antiterminator RfaH
MAELLNKTITNDYRWYAIYTRLNHEKAVESNLLEKNIEVFLPKRKTLHKWSDRKKWVEEPLFRPYVFVRVSNKEYYEVLQTTSVCNYICFEGKAASIPDNQIDLIRKVIDENLTYDIVNQNLEINQKVEVIAGPLTGLKAEVINKKNKNHIVIVLKELNCSLLVDIDINAIRSTKYT